MIELAVAQMKRDAAWQAVLAAYDAADAGPPPSDEPDEGWVSRLREVEGVAAADLSRVHGKLIAFGLLEFDLAGRAGGVRYRLSRQGKSLLRSNGEAACEEDREELLTATEE